MGSDVGANELVMRHPQVSLVAPSFAAMSSLSAIRNKVCDIVLYAKSATRQKCLIFSLNRAETHDPQSKKIFFFFVT